MSVTKEAVLDRLKTVNGPDFTGNIVDMGLVSDVFISDSRRSIFRSPFPPSAPANSIRCARRPSAW